MALQTIIHDLETEQQQQYWDKTEGGRAQPLIKKKKNGEAIEDTTKTG